MFKSKKELIAAIKSAGLRTINTEEEYNNMLDDVYDNVNICGYEYSASHALWMTDPIAHRCGHADYCSDQVSDGVWIDGGNGYYCIHDVAKHFEMDAEDILDLF